MGFLSKAIGAPGKVLGQIGGTLGKGPLGGVGRALNLPGARPTGGGGFGTGATTPGGPAMSMAQPQDLAGGGGELAAPKDLAAPKGFSAEEDEGMSAPRTLARPRSFGRSRGFGRR